MIRLAFLVVLAVLLFGCGKDRPDVMRDGSLTIMRQNVNLNGSGGTQPEILVVHDAKTGQTWVVADRDSVLIVQGDRR